MLVEIKRFMTAAEVRKETNAPDELWAVVEPILPPVHQDGNGGRIYYEGDIDEALSAYFREARQKTVIGERAPKGKPGRKNETFEIALFANQLRTKKVVWKQVLAECKKRWPNDQRVRNVNQLRGTLRRHLKKKN